MQPRTFPLLVLLVLPLSACFDAFDDNHPPPIDATLDAPYGCTPTERLTYDYQPPAEVSPIVWRLVLDLEIVEKSRCNQVASAVHDE